MDANSRWTPVLFLLCAASLFQPALTIAASPAFLLSEAGMGPHVGERPDGLSFPHLTGAKGLESNPPDSPMEVHRGPDSSTPDKKGTSGKRAPDEVQTLKERIIDLQNKGRLGFRKIVACTSVEGYGVYSPIEPGQKVGKLVLYCEPANVSTMKSQDRYIIDCAVDFLLLDSSGKVLGGKENALRINRISRSPVMDLYFKVEMRLRKVLNRSVFIKTVLHDKIKNKTVFVINRINVESGVKKKDHGI